MATSRQQFLPVMPLQRVDGSGETDLQILEDGFMPVGLARLELGAAFGQAVRNSGAGLKEFGDPAQVGRCCKGLEVPALLVRFWQHPAARREFVIALAEQAGFSVQTTMSVPHAKRRAM